VADRKHRRGPKDSGRESNDSYQERHENKPEGRDHEGNGQEFDDPEEHRRIENRRFEGGLPPTPELYERARAQWNQLTGAVTKPPTDRSPGEPGEGDENPPGQAPPAGKGEKQ